MYDILLHQTIVCYFHRFFLQDLANPDLLFVIWFLYSQLTISVVLGLLLGSKVGTVTETDICWFAFLLILTRARLFEEN